MIKQTRNTMRQTIYRTICGLLLLAFVASVSSCGTIDSLLRYVLSLPMTILNSLPGL